MQFKSNPGLKLLGFFSPLELLLDPFGLTTIGLRFLVLGSSENASLMPWFAMTALIHSLIILERRESLYSWVIILCTHFYFKDRHISCKIGILNSVHTFANDPSRGLYILVLLFLMVVISFAIFFTKTKKETYIFENFSRSFILSNNWFMAFYLITVFIGTVYPIFIEVLLNNKISVGPPFYNLVIAPIIIPFLFYGIRTKLKLDKI